MIHRDLKPANVLLAPAEPDRVDVLRPGPTTAAVVPKLADFGLAWRDRDGDEGEAGQRFTRTDAILGTPYYMAPEQAAGRQERFGPPTDVYALGVILYECLTGGVPFKGTDVLDTLEQVRQDDPVAPRQRRRDCPRDLETICLHCLHKNPGWRYPTARALADDLRRYLAHEPIQARREPSRRRLAKWVRRHPGRPRSSVPPPSPPPRSRS